MRKLRLRQFCFLALFHFFTAFLELSCSQSVNQSDERCPEGYFLHSDELCYPKVRKPCPFQSQTTTSTETSATEAATRPPINFKKLDCPDGSILLANKCRKIICTLGEYYRGACLLPVCPQGLVWRGKKCQQPGYLTTILEIDNVIANEVIEKPFAVSTVNKVVHHPPATTERPVYSTQSLPLTMTTDTTDASSIIYNVTDHTFSGGCCKVFTPRLCKLYGNKWLCFNRKYESCDSHVCKAPVVYLKAPEIKYEPPLLVMPPNPKLTSCEGQNCQNNSDTVDCSGCSNFLSETCSSHCYRYICPSNSCTFMDLYEYCSNRTRKNGCSPTDGCLWKWCQL